MLSHGHSVSSQNHNPFTLFKHEKDRELFFCMSPIAQIIACDISYYCFLKKKKFTITETVSTIHDDKLLKRVSDTHRTGRAFDVRTREWSMEFCVELCSHFNKKYSEFSAINKSGEKRLMVLKSDHIHVQIARIHSVF